MSEHEQIGTTGDLRCSGSMCENLNCYWKIDNFSTLDQTVGAVYYSDSIPSVEEKNFSWQLMMYPGGSSDEHEGTVQWYLGIENKMEVSLWARRSFYARNSDNRVIVRSLDPNGIAFDPGMTYAILEIPRNTLLDRIEDDIVIITAEIVYSRSTAKDGETTRFLTGVSPYQTLGDDYSNLPRRMNPDVLIIVDGAEIPAHKAVLSARSRIFATMIDEEEFESNIPRIEIADFDADLVKSMLQFIYSGTVDHMNVEKAFGLLRIGARYELDSLASHCRTFLSAQLNESKEIEALLLAAIVINCSEIRAQVIEYICENVSAEDLKSKYSSLKQNRRLLFDCVVRMIELYRT